MKKLYTLMLLALLTPFLLANQTVDVDVPYIMTFVNNSGYDLDTGSVVSDTDFARTDKKINRNSIIYVNDFNLFTYVLFYDNLDQYIGYYTTPNSELYGSDWITAISSNEFSPPSNAYYFAYMIDKVTQNIDTPDYTDLNNLSLREVFEDGNLVTNGDFSDGTTGWSAESNAVISNVDGKLQVTLGTLNYKYGYQEIQFTNTNKYYLSANGYYGTVGWKYGILNASLSTIVNSSTQTTDFRYSTIYQATTTETVRVALYADSTLDGGYTQYDNIYALNLTALGIDLTKEQMDYYFALYQNNPNITGIAFNTFDDLTTTYRQTFYDPLPQDSIVLIVAGILGIGLMLLGFITRARIFNLFSVAPFTVIGLLLPNPAIIIAMFGLIIWQVYYAFWSKV